MQRYQTISCAVLIISLKKICWRNICFSNTCFVTYQLLNLTRIKVTAYKNVNSTNERITCIARDNENYIKFRTDQFIKVKSMVVHLCCKSNINTDYQTNPFLTGADILTEEILIAGN